MFNKYFIIIQYGLLLLQYGIRKINIRVCTYGEKYGIL